jgi:hypothetical protein
MPPVIRFKFNIDATKLRAELEKLAKAHEFIKEAVGEVGQALKEEVLKGPWDAGHDLKNTGKFWGYLQSEVPEVHSEGAVVYTGFGKLDNLNKITRPPETIPVTRPNGNVHVIKTKGSDFPIWLALEFGIRRLGENPPPELTTHGKTTQSAPMEYIGTREDTGKRLFLMSPKGKLKHRGIKPARLFRKGLYRIKSRKLLPRAMEGALFGVSSRAKK